MFLTRRSLVGLRELFVATAASALPFEASAAANEFNDELLKKPVAEQRAVLQYIIGDRCVVTRAFFNGIAKRGPAKGRAFWSATCKDGRTFMVMIPPRLEDTRVIECDKLKELGLGNCFKKLKD